MNEEVISNSNELNEEQKTIDIVPLPKGRRVLLFLADLFLNFILSFVVLNLLVVPLGKVFSSFDAKTIQYNNDITNRAVVLYTNGVVIDSGDVDKGNLIYNVSFSYYCYLSYYCYDEESPANLTHAQFGHKNENEMIRQERPSKIDNLVAFNPAMKIRNVSIS